MVTSSFNFNSILSGFLDWGFLLLGTRTSVPTQPQVVRRKAQIFQWVNENNELAELFQLLVLSFWIPVSYLLISLLYNGSYFKFHSTLRGQHPKHTEAFLQAITLAESWKFHFYALSDRQLADGKICGRNVRSNSYTLSVTNAMQWVGPLFLSDVMSDLMSINQTLSEPLGSGIISKAL